MLRAIDVKTNKMVFASRDEVHLQSNYVCPCCGKEVRNVPATEKRPYFKHNKNEACEYYRYSSSDNTMSEWHSEWQEQFPIENTEKVISINGERRIADVCVGDTVVEFQHSSINEDVFFERSWFYLKNGYNLIWVFDTYNAYIDDRLDYYDISNHKIKWKWKNPRRALRYFSYLKQKYKNNFKLCIECNDLYNVTWSNDNFSRFVTDTRIDTSRFVKEIMARDWRIPNCKNYLICVDEKEGCFNGRTYHNYILLTEDETGYRDEVILRESNLKNVTINGSHITDGSYLHQCIYMEIKYLDTYDSYGKSYVKELNLI